MKTLNTSMKLTALAALALLTACGGGSGSTTSGGGGNGGGGGSTPITSCSNNATNPPTCDALPARNFKADVPKPPYPDDSDDLKAFNYLNDVRANLGLSKLQYSAELDKAAYAHGQYSRLNMYLGHIEISGNPGFTGATHSDRIKAAGGAFEITSEVVGHGKTKAGTVDNLMRSIYHRGILLKQSWTHVGMGLYQYPNAGNSISNVINPVYVSESSKTVMPSDYMLMYPKDGATGVYLTAGSETPWPFPDVVYEPSIFNKCTNLDYDPNICKFGFPVSFAVSTDWVLSNIQATIMEKGSNTPLPAWVHTMYNDTNRLVEGNEVYITKRGGMKPLTTYVVRVKAEAKLINVARGAQTPTKNIDKEWSFTTSSVKDDFNTW